MTLNRILAASILAATFTAAATRPSPAQGIQAVGSCPAGYVQVGALIRGEPGQPARVNCKKIQAPRPTPTAAATPKAAPSVLPRLSWSTFVKDPHRLSQLTRAIAYMRSLDSSPKASADYRRSWQYWANIHGYYGFAKDGTTAGPDGRVQDILAYLQKKLPSGVAYYDGTIGPKITNQIAPDDLAELIWATCEHSGTDDSGAFVQANFFGWHRMYLYYFEQVLQWAAGRPGPPDTSLRLPYWDYINPTSLALPTEFQAAGPFVEAKRAPGMNTGAKKLDARFTNVNSLLTNSLFLSTSGFEYNVEFGVHAYIHCTVGLTCPVAYMGDVPVAANDPIFYDHHAEIDRIWACWQKLHGLAGPPDQRFTFVDGTGTKVTNTVSNFLDTTKLGYTYESTDCTQPRTQPLKMRREGFALLATAPIVGSIKAVSITDAVTTISVPIPKTPRLLAALKHLDTAQTFVLTLRNVTADSPPGVLFAVYLAKAGDPAQRRQVGIISWFGAFAHHGVRRAADLTLTYDATDALRALGVNALGDKGASVVIEASTGRVAANGLNSQENVLAAGTFRAVQASAKVHIGAIELRAAP